MKRIIILVILILTLAVNVPFSKGCDDEVDFKIISFGANKLEAVAGENIELSWSYQEAGRLTRQVLKILTLTFIGIREQEVPLSNSSRSYSFTFTGPIDILLVAEAEDDDDQAALSIHQIQNFYLRMSASSDDPLYPYLGYASIVTGGGGGCDGLPISISYKHNVALNFTKFFGFYDDPENHVVDDITDIFSKDYMFRALSMCVDEASNFCLKEGSAYPAAVFNEPTAGFANAILFGGTIVTDGEEITYKAQDGEGIARTGVTGYAMVFVAIIYRIGFTANVANYVDIQIGNLKQGLVTTANYNNLGSSTYISDGPLRWYNLGTPSGTIWGEIKQAIVGYPITKLDGTITDTFVNLVQIEFNMPFLPDTRIEAFID